MNDIWAMYSYEQYDVGLDVCYSRPFSAHLFAAYGSFYGLPAEVLGIAEHLDTARADSRGHSPRALLLVLFRLKLSLTQNLLLQG